MQYTCMFIHYTYSSSNIWNRHRWNMWRFQILLVTTSAKLLFEVLARLLCIALGDIVRAFIMLHMYTTLIGILAENIRSSFCVVKFYAIKKACELVGIKFLLISNSFYLTWVPPVGNCIHICHLCIWISRGSIQNGCV